MNSPIAGVSKEICLPPVTVPASGPASASSIPFPGRAAEVIFSLHIFQIERELECVLVFDFLLRVGPGNRGEARRRGQRRAETELQCAPA
jgi:hypothetical protein